MANKPETAYVNDIMRELDKIGAVAVKTHGNPYFRKGTPDIIGAYHGRPFVIEAKVGNNKAEPKQEYEWSRWADAGSYSYIVNKDAYTAKEVVNMLRYDVDNYEYRE
jgi:hypothetical protein